ncbi:MAG: DUF1190 domain-containing protein [Methylocystis sp.]|nr:DUF1190 domain-containing protein [Methylocystis sp.]
MAVAGASVATSGKTYFFATQEACTASRTFTARECAAAFINAKAQLEDRAPRFESSGDCRLRFRLCEVRWIEPQQDEALAYAETDAVAFMPMALGVELIKTARGVEAAPTLAVDTPTKLFPYFPVSLTYEARMSLQPRTEPENSAILSADRFEPFSERQPFTGATTFIPAALGAIEGATNGSASYETREERRARLKNAPFVE